MKLDLQQCVDDLFDEQVSVLKSLVASKSTRGNEAEAQQLMAQEMAKDCQQVDELEVDLKTIEGLRGYSPSTVDYSGMKNIIGLYGNPDGQGRSLILNGHIDVVPEGYVGGWSHDPFDPIVKNNKLYGRGSSDMKAGLTAKLFALRAIKKAGFMPNSSVYLQSVVEEECTGNGALSCLAAGYKADAVLIAEPFNEVLVSAQLGVIWFQIKLYGKPVHAEKATEGVNAIEAMLPVIEALRVLEKTWNHEKHQHDHYSCHKHPINLNIAEFHGGDWTSSVPSWATLNCRIAIYPGDKIEGRQQLLEKAISELSKTNPLVAKAQPEVAYHGFLAEGYELQTETDAEDVLSQAHELIFSETLQRQAITATTDARFYGLYEDTPSLVYGPTGEGFHGFDECVHLDSLKRVTQVYAQFIEFWCGLSRCDGN